MVAGVAILLGSIAFASWGNDESLRSPQEAATPAANDTPLRAFRATALDGTTIDSARLKGPAVIHIYASWCPTCKAEAPDFARFLAANPSIKPIYIAVADRPDAAQAFLAAHRWRAGPIIDDPRRSLASKLGLTGQPNTIFIGAGGGTQVLRGGGSLASLQRIADAS